MTSLTTPTGSAAGAAGDDAPASYRQATVRVMGGGELGAYVLLSAIATLAIVAFGAFWASLPDWGETPWQHRIVTALIAYLVTAWLLRWSVLPMMRRPVPPAALPAMRIAVVTTIVPSAESRHMLERTVRALVAMDGAHDTWVLDEEDDADVRALCEQLGARHFTRLNRQAWRTNEGPFAIGTKYGNYNAWLAAEGARYDVTVSFDPDHVPERQYLLRTVPYLTDPGVGYVQAPQVYYNQSVSWIARGAAEETYDFYSAHQMASFGLGHPIVVGCHTVHRTDALRAVGGFPAHDADDLLLTLRYRAAGWRGVYVPEVLARGLTPASWSGYMRQQSRWARSVLDIKVRALPGLVGRLPLVERLASVLHGIFYFRALVAPVAFVLIAWMIGTRGLPSFVRPPALMAIAALAVVLGVVGLFRQRFYLQPDERGVKWRPLVLQFAKWPALVRAVLHALRRKPVRYEVTLKVATGGGRELVLWPHLAVSVLLLEAWIAGAILEPPISLIRTGLAAVVVAAGLALAWSEAREYPPAYDPDLYERATGADATKR